MLLPLPLVSLRVISFAMISTSLSSSSVTFKPPPALLESLKATVPPELIPLREPVEIYKSLKKLVDEPKS